jgi:hypothetical protein
MKNWNVLIPVVEVVRAETSAEAVEILRTKIRAADLDEYEGAVGLGEPGLDVFEADDDGEELQG